MVKAPPADWFNRSDSNMDGALPPSGYGVITRSDSGSTVIIGPYGTETIGQHETGKSLPTEVFGRLMREMGRDTAGSSGSSGSAGNSGNSGQERQAAPRIRNPARSEPELLLEFPEPLQR
jgi:hypothetical protein